MGEVCRPGARLVNRRGRCQRRIGQPGRPGSSLQISSGDGRCPLSPIRSHQRVCTRPSGNSARIGSPVCNHALPPRANAGLAKDCSLRASCAREAPHLAHVHEFHVQGEVANPHGYWVCGRILGSDQGLAILRFNNYRLVQSSGSRAIGCLLRKPLHSGHHADGGTPSRSSFALKPARVVLRPISSIPRTSRVAEPPTTPCSVQACRRSADRFVEASAMIM